MGHIGSAYMNGGTSALAEHLSPPHTLEPLSLQPLEPESQPTPAPGPASASPTPTRISRKLSHQLLAVHRTSFKEEDEEELVQDHLADGPAELIAAGEC